MRFILSMLAVFTLGLSVLTACQDAAPPVKIEAAKTIPTSAPKTDEHGHADDAPRIMLADAKADFDAGTAILVDTRAEGAYKQEHIKGAINVPFADFEANYQKIPNGKKIIAYCS
jgi:3-mercaptopyruvate sulfurtransferase SseA